MNLSAHKGQKMPTPKEPGLGAALLAEIEAWCTRTQVPEWTVGDTLLRHPGYVALLRKRGTVAPRTAVKIRAFLKANPCGLPGADEIVGGLAVDVIMFCARSGITKARFARYVGQPTSDALNRAIRMADKPGDKTAEQLRTAMARWSPNAPDAPLVDVEGAHGTMSSAEVARRRAETEAAHEARAVAARAVAERERSDAAARRQRMATQVSA